MSRMTEELPLSFTIVLRRSEKLVVKILKRKVVSLKLEQHFTGMCIYMDVPNKGLQIP